MTAEDIVREVIRATLHHVAFVLDWPLATDDTKARACCGAEAALAAIAYVECDAETAEWCRATRMAAARASAQYAVRHDETQWARGYVTGLEARR